MRLIYLTDIHGAFERVRDLLYETIADVYIIAGDLIDIPFYNMDTAIRYHELQTYFSGLQRQMDKKDMVIEDFVDELMNLPDLAPDLEDKGTKYQQYTIRARRVMQQKYKVLENMILTKPSSRCYCLPGNYDMDLKYTALHERDLHLHWYQTEDLRIAGYGGADIFTAGIPERYVVSYRAGIGTNDRKNEMYLFLKAVKPDIIVSHQPAHGIHDWITPRGPSGSPALRTFCDNNPVLLCLTGHIHNQWGFKSSDGTIYLNPSNFGEVTLLTGDVHEGGFFHQVEIEDNAVTQVLFRKIVEDRIHDVAEYRADNGAWKEKIIDEARYEALRRYENLDIKIKKYSHIPEIVLFKEIKQFFKTFQTQETEERLETLEKALIKFEDRLEDVALDVVGSVNVGQAQPSSDIDLVLYMRCDGNCADMHTSCGKYQKARAVIEEALGGQYKFEILDCIDLNIVEKSIREKNYECEVTQRFVAYRSICRTINYRVIAPVEDLLNEDIEFRKELEGSIRSYFKIFITNTRYLQSFEKYVNRLKTVGIKLPDSMKRKIKAFLEEEAPPPEK
jgi:Icc-related predicted phosphoesterase